MHEQALQALLQLGYKSSGNWLAENQEAIPQRQADQIALAGRWWPASISLERRGMLMKKAMNELPTRLEAGGVCFQGQDWGDTNVARVRFPAGADATPLLEGLPNNLCQCPHWGAVLKGSIHVTYADGTEETVNAGDVYYWPPGHTVRVDEDYEAIEFSPSDQMGELMEHLEAKLKG